MGVESKWLAQWFAKLFGRAQAGSGGQHSSGGAGATHIGQAAGPVTTVHQLTQNFYAAPPPVQGQQQPVRGRFKGRAKLEHKEALALMNHLPVRQRKQVLQQMNVDYGTSMVKELWPDEVVKLHAHVESILRASVERARA